MDENQRSDVAALLAKVQKQEAELQQLKVDLAAARSKSECIVNGISTHSEQAAKDWPLKPEEYQRYGRQMILPEIGLEGQLSLRGSSVLIVGVGGLGCPASIYLASAGVGTLGLMDGDTVEVSNLHRQILHRTTLVDCLKVDSAASTLRELNPHVNYVLHPEHLTPTAAVQTFKQYDLVLDCTDHPTSRYLISDAAVLAGVPLVSASALRTEGQLLVLNNPPKSATQPGGPCYRCIFPIPPRPETVMGCGEGGILGPVVGVMGVLMAVEALKVLTMRKDSAGIQQEVSRPEPHSMLIYSAYAATPFRTLKMKGKRKECASCSETPSISEDSLASGSLDYAVFCGVLEPVKILTDEERVTAPTLAEDLKNLNNKPLLLDVRDEIQFAICNIPGSINIPSHVIDSIRTGGTEITKARELEELRNRLEESPSSASVYAICRFGNDSQLAIRKLKDAGIVNNGRWAGDVKGGFHAWKREVDTDWPEY